MAMAFSRTNQRRANILQTVPGYASSFFQRYIAYGCLRRIWYLATVVPGAIGANRRDRIPVYFMRSLVLSFFVMIPSFIVQFFSEPILEAANISHDVASEVGIYTKWFILVISGLIIEANFQIVFQNLFGTIWMLSYHLQQAYALMFFAVGSSFYTSTLVSTGLFGRKSVSKGAASFPGF
eukprot:UN01537